MKKRVMLALYLVLVAVATIRSVIPGCSKTGNAAPRATPAAVSDLEAILGTSAGILFTSNRDGNAEIYKATTGGLVRLTNSQADELSAVWSPDRSRIAFTRGNGLYVMNADGSGTEKISGATGVFGTPAWSPEGSKIVFIGQDTGNSELYSVSPAGGPAVMLTNTPGFEASPVFAPDGVRIAYCVVTAGRGEIWTMNADGSGAAVLDNGTHEESSPAWSPDGTRIAYAAYAGNYSEIYTVPSAGGRARRITSDYFDNAKPAWSPDGRRIAFVTEGGGSLGIMKPDGSDRQVIAANCSEIRSVKWSPDGRCVAYSGDCNGNSELFAVVYPRMFMLCISNDPGEDVLMSW